jgi:hypothetical protein
MVIPFLYATTVLRIPNSRLSDIAHSIIKEIRWGNKKRDGIGECYPFALGVTTSMRG